MSDVIDYDGDLMDPDHEIHRDIADLEEQLEELRDLGIDPEDPMDIQEEDELLGRLADLRAMVLGDPVPSQVEDLMYRLGEKHAEYVDLQRQVEGLLRRRDEVGSQIGQIRSELSDMGVHDV